MKCRLCLIECHEENSVSLFSNDEESNLTKLIAKYLYIEVTQLDAFSTVTCKDCVQSLNEFHKFFQFVEQQQQVLQNEFLEIKCVVSEKPFIATSDLDGAQADLEHNDESMLDIKDVINEDDICLDRSISIDEFGYADEHFDTPLENETESEEDVPLQTLLSKAKRMSRDTKVAKKVNPQLRAQKLSCEQKTNKRKYLTKKRKLKENKINKTKCDDEDSIKKLVNIEDKSEKSRNYLTPQENKLRDEMVTKYVDLKCEICSTQVDTYDSLKTHFRKEHKRKAFFTCCGKRFLRRFLLLDHIQSHLNPEHFKCKICDKVLKSRVSLNLHNANMHADREELKNGCPLCGKRFKHPSNLSTHMQVHTKERNYLCELCKKGYKSNNLLKMHIQNVHGERTPYICETCGKEYRFKLSFERHVAEHQGQPKEPALQCKICGNWYTRYNLQRHMKRHILENVDCETCGKKFKSKVALASHIKGSHQKREKIYSCTFCNKTFERPRYLKEHIDMHTGQKEYKCTYCVREFRSKANMYSHVKKMHHEQWAEAKLARNRSLESFAENQKLTKTDLSFE